ncbi:MAG: hypothetical protein AB1468_03105 [Candidatus Micrarchaeota archaeon]
MTQQTNPLTPNELNEHLISIGVSKLDASLLVNCVIQKKSYTWMNNDPVSDGADDRINSLLRGRGLAAIVEITDAGTRGKIWEVKIPREHAAPPIPDKPFSFGFGIQ